MEYSNDNFKIGIKAKKLFTDLFMLMDDIPRKDLLLKEKINNTSFSLLKAIYFTKFIEEATEMNYAAIRSNIELLCAQMEMLYHKKYISVKQLESHIYLTKEISKMSYRWKEFLENKVVEQEEDMNNI